MAALELKVWTTILKQRNLGANGRYVNAALSVPRNAAATTDFRGGRHFRKSLLTEIFERDYLHSWRFSKVLRHSFLSLKDRQGASRALFDCKDAQLANAVGIMNPTAILKHGTAAS